VALLLWCFNPFVLGFGALVKPDVPAAAMGAWAAYRFWKWLREPIWPNALLAGTALGLAELTKFTLLVFFLIWPAAWLAKRLWFLMANLSARRARTHRKTSDAPMVDDEHAPPVESAPYQRFGAWQELRQLASIVVLALVVVNAGYAFSGSFQRLDKYRFQSRVLSGQSAADPPRAGNRFATSWLARVPVPLPRDFVQGIDRQRTDFEQGERSYLCGRWQPRGWWHYHLFGLMIKTPLGTLGLVGLTLCLTFARLVRRVPATCAVGDDLFLLAPAVAMLALVSSQTGFSNHVRYTIPALPYLFIWCGKCVRWGSRRRSLARGCCRDIGHRGAPTKRFPRRGAPPRRFRDVRRSAYRRPTRPLDQPPRPGRRHAERNIARKSRRSELLDSTPGIHRDGLMWMRATRAFPRDADAR
jgi:hypothetical protein